MPPSCSHGTKRKVATPEPEPDADVDTEEEEEEAAAGGNNTGCPQGVHLDLQTCDKKERSRRKRKRFGAMPAPTAPMLYPTRSQSS